MKKKIMLIMPELPVRGTFADFFNEVGYHVNVLEDPSGAVRSTCQFKPNLIICYENFAHNSGQEIAGTLKKSNGLSKIPFLLVSPKPLSEEGIEPDALCANVDGTIHLPVDRAELYGCVTNWLECEDPLSIMGNRPYVDPPQVQPTAVMMGEPKQDKPWNKGTVSLSSIVKLLYRLIENGKSGVLLLRSDRKKIKVMVESGHLVDVQSNYIRDDTFGKYLMSVDKLTDDRNESTLTYARENDIPQGEAILKMGLLSSDQLRYHITEHKIIKLLRVFQRRWYKSKFVFNETEVSHGDLTFRPTPLHKIITMGVFNVARKNDMYDLFYKNDRERYTLRIGPDFDQVVMNLDIGTALVGQAMQIKGMSIEQIKTVRVDQFDTNLRLAFLLVLTKAMVFEK